MLSSIVNLLNTSKIPFHGGGCWRRTLTCWCDQLLVLAPWPCHLCYLTRV